MADGRDVKVWTNHAKEQLRDNPEVHNADTNNPMYKWLQERKDVVKRVLDLGCGTGLWRNYFKDFQYIGADQNSAMIEGAMQRGMDESESFVQVSWDKLPFEDGTFDAVFTSAVIQHNLHPQKAHVVKEIKRVLRPEGFYICTENTFREDNYQTTFAHIAKWHPGLDDGYSFTPKGWEIWMGREGFKLLEYSPPSEYIYQV